MCSSYFRCSKYKQTAQFGLSMLLGVMTQVCTLTSHYSGLSFESVLQTFVIDKEGKCVMSFNDQMGAEKHVEEALQVIKTLA